MTTTNTTFKTKLVDNLLKNWKKYIFYLIVLFSIVLFIYALGFATSWARTEVLGKTFRATQPLFDLAKQTNDIIALLAVIGLVGSVLNLMVGTHIRKKYYWTNYVLIWVVVVFSLATGVYIFVGSAVLKNEFANSFANFQDEWNYLIQLSFQSNDIRPSIIEALNGALPFLLIGLINAGLGIWLFVDERLKHQSYLDREVWVNETLAKVEKGEIKVSEKVMNQIPTVDEEIIDFTEKEVLAYEHKDIGKFYENHKLLINASYIWTLLVTVLMIGLPVISTIVDALNHYGIIDFNTASIVNLHSSLIGFATLILLLIGLINLGSLKVIRQIKTEEVVRQTLIGHSIYLIFTTIFGGLLLLPIALKVPTAKNEVDRMRYQNNSTGYTLTFGGLIFFIWSLFTSINYSLFTGLADEVRVKPDFNVGLDITISIVLILVIFLSAEKVKAYSIKWSYGLMVISAINIARIFYVPLLSFNSNQIPMDIFVQIAIAHSISAILTLVAGFVSLNKSKKLKAYLTQGGK
ncbi:hypothetical protein [Acholeplasma granularum]|uniref:hypothetical protein n=1 Tax=Acholeplasma granularum TaxID=264635 RepID=UPI000472B1F4|nr:hypothetical protein [Acholeplasma granularum]